jgi:hypothetical protein
MDAPAPAKPIPAPAENRKIRDEEGRIIRESVLRSAAIALARHEFLDADARVNATLTAAMQFERWVLFPELFGLKQDAGLTEKLKEGSAGRCSMH